MNNDHLGEIGQFLNAYREDGDDELIANPIAYHWLTVGSLRAAVAELKQLRAERAALGGAEHQWRIITPNGPTCSFTQRDLDDHANWLPGVRLEQRTVYGTQWEPADPQQTKPADQPTGNAQ